MRNIKDKMMGKQKKKKTRVRRTNETIAQVKLEILADLFNGKELYMTDIIREYAYKDKRNAKKDLHELLAQGIPVYIQKNRVRLAVELEGLWKGTLVGDRLIDSIQSKQRLAQEVVNFLLKKKDEIRRIILGSGTTMRVLTQQLLKSRTELAINNIFTANLLVLREFIANKITPEEKPQIHMTPGRLNIFTGSLYSDDGIKSLGSSPAQAVITSFDGLDYDEITTGQHHELSEKIMNLMPNNKKCRYVIIPMEWSKIGASGVVIVEKEEGKGTVELLDTKKREYIIIVDPQDENIEKCKILKHWQQKGVKIIPEKIVADA